MPGIEPGTSHMRSARSTTELHPPAEKPFSAKGIHSVLFSAAQINKVSEVYFGECLCSTFLPFPPSSEAASLVLGDLMQLASGTQAGRVSEHSRQRCELAAGGMGRPAPPGWRDARALSAPGLGAAAALPRRRGGREGATAGPPAPPGLAVATQGPRRPALCAGSVALVLAETCS